MDGAHILQLPPLNNTASLLSKKDKPIFQSMINFENKREYQGKNSTNRSRSMQVHVSKLFYILRRQCGFAALFHIHVIFQLEA